MDEEKSWFSRLLQSLKECVVKCFENAKSFFFGTMSWIKSGFKTLKSCFCGTLSWLKKGFKRMKRCCGSMSCLKKLSECCRSISCLKRSKNSNSRCSPMSCIKNCLKKMKACGRSCFTGIRRCFQQLKAIGMSCICANQNSDILIRYVSSHIRFEILTKFSVMDSH
jgi:hypothetical protein